MKDKRKNIELSENRKLRRTFGPNREKARIKLKKTA